MKFIKKVILSVCLLSITSSPTIFDFSDSQPLAATNLNQPLIGELNFSYQKQFYGFFSSNYWYTQPKVLVPNWNKYASNWEKFNCFYQKLDFVSSKIIIDGPYWHFKRNVFQISMSQVTLEPNSLLVTNLTHQDDWYLKINIVIFHTNTDILWQLFFSEYSYLAPQETTVNISLNNFVLV